MIIAPCVSDSTNQMMLLKFPNVLSHLKESKPERMERESMGEIDSPDEIPVSSSIDESDYGTNERESGCE